MRSFMEIDKYSYSNIGRERVKKLLAKRQVVFKPLFLCIHHNKIKKFIDTIYRAEPASC
jgi:hypothetical protein